MNEGKKVLLPISYYYSVKKTLLFLPFVGILWYFCYSVFVAAEYKFEIWGSETIGALFLGIVVLAGFAMLWLFMRIILNRTKAVLTLSGQGIELAFGREPLPVIPWSDLAEVKIDSKFIVKNILLVIHNPEAYMDNVTSKVNRQVLKTQMSQYGTPIVIGTALLNAGAEDIAQTILDARP